jgi:hypothetical protein
MSTSSTSASWPSPAGVAALLDEALHAGPGHPRPALRYLRRKPGRGLVAVYGDPADEMYTVTVDEDAPSGDATIQRFPEDARLPGLAESVRPSRDGAVWAALSAAAAAQHGQPVVVESVSAVPLRYKPGDRCVIRYRLSARTRSGEELSIPVIGKLYRDVRQAWEATELAELLWAVQGSHPWAPRPLGVAAPLPLALTQDLGSATDTPPTVAGTEVLRMGGGSSTAVLHAAATALADLHMSGVAQVGTAERTGAHEAVKGANRAATIARYVPELAGQAMAVTGALGRALEGARPGVARPAHGSFKPSQLLCRDGAVLMVDFDQFCLADPALDLGYFLAYLRPPSIWYHRSGTRAWFEEAAAAFLSAYGDAARTRGMDPEELDGARRRSHVYEAALLLKIAARRPNRMHSPRPKEVRALLDEADACLRAAAGPPHVQA